MSLGSDPFTQAQSSNANPFASLFSWLASLFESQASSNSALFSRGAVRAAVAASMPAIEAGSVDLASPSNDEIELQDVVNQDLQFDKLAIDPDGKNMPSEFDDAIAEPLANIEQCMLPGVDYGDGLS